MSARQMLSRLSLSKLPWDVDVAEDGGNVKLWKFEKVKKPVEHSPHP